MTRLRWTTAGESHGPALVGVIEGLPAGLPLELARVDAELARRQRGYGRGGRMKIESDAVELLGGVRHGRTLGSPVAIRIENRDFANWSDEMAVEPGASAKPVTVPRPGHADLAGAQNGGLQGRARTDPDHCLPNVDQALVRLGDINPVHRKDDVASQNDVLSIDLRHDRAALQTELTCEPAAGYRLNK